MAARFTRFRPDARSNFQSLKDAADAYPRQLTETEKLGFWQKPFDWSKGHPNYLNNMSQLLNGIQAMDLAPGATIVEVGSGAGWATEILAGLKYHVICLEPAEVMLDAAKVRVAKFLDSRVMSDLASNVAYHCVTLEEADLAEGSADAVLFFESFHHVIDEDASLRQVRRVLKPGGVLCILGDSNWIPGLKAQEDFWIEEMQRFGTLESPFTHEYLVALLNDHGFEEVHRHHSISKLVPVERQAEPVRNFVDHLDASYVNLVTARRPFVETRVDVPDAANPPVHSSGAVTPTPAGERLMRLGAEMSRKAPFTRPMLRWLFRRFFAS